MADLTRGDLNRLEAAVLQARKPNYETLAVIALARIGLDAGADWRERAAKAPSMSAILLACGEMNASAKRSVLAALRWNATRIRALPSADADQRRAASMSEYRRVTAQGGSILPPHKSAAAQDQSSEARRELAPLEQEDAERASPAKGHTPASTADPEDSCYDHDEFRPSDYYEIPAAGQEPLAGSAAEIVEGNAPSTAAFAQPRGDLTWQEARERVLVKWPEARAIHADLRRPWYVWTDSPSSLSSFALCFAPTEAEAWLRAAKGL